MFQLKVCKTILIQLLLAIFIAQHSFVRATGGSSDGDSVNQLPMDSGPRTNAGRSYSDNDLVAALRQQGEEGAVGVAPMMSPEYFAQLKRSWKNLQGGWGKRSSADASDQPSLEELNDYLDATKDAHANMPIEDYINAIALLNGGSGSYAPESADGSGKFYEAKRAWKNMNSAWGKRLANGGGGLGGSAPGNWNKFRGSWGKREPGWNNLKGLWGKRSGSAPTGSGWNKLSSSWGK